MKLWIVEILTTAGWLPHSAGWWHTRTEAKRHLYDHVKRGEAELRVRKYTRSTCQR